jgi:RimJ/RimL family protein N-acetyltransferase
MRPSDGETLELETPRLLLRRPKRRDLAEIVPLADNWSVASKLGAMPHPYRLSDARSFLAEVDRDWGRDGFTFALIHAEAPAQPLCGMISVFALVAGQPTLGFWLAEPWWGQGLMTEAVGALVRFAFDRLQAPQLEAHHLVDNPASGRVLEKNGFVETGRAPLWSRAHLRYQPGRLMRRAAEASA